MSEFFKSKKKMILTLSLVIVIITVITGSVAFIVGDFEWSFNAFAGFGEKSKSDEEEQPTGPEDGDPEAVEALVVGKEDAEEEPVFYYNTPGVMRGVFLVPGTDFLLNGTSSTSDEVRGEIDAALDNAVSLTMNTVIIDTSYGDRVIYQSADAKEVSSDFDIMAYFVEGARQRNLYTYAIFDVSLYQEESAAAVKLSANARGLNLLESNLREFAESYRPDGILIDGYQNPQEESSYSAYLSTGGAIGYDNYMRQSPDAVVRTASRTIHTYTKGMQVGLLADAVWANEDEVEDGSATSAAYTALNTANADTKSFLEQDDLFDFVAVKAYGSLTDSAEPFKEVVAWWAELARSNDIPLYAIHASDRACSEAEGWEAHDQLTKQLIEVEDIGGYRGSIYNSLARLVEDPKEATTTLIKYYNAEVEAAHILTELEITKPEQTTFTTFEPIVTFTGASDPNSLVTINGEEIPTDASGYFTLSINLDPGVNVFTIEHKEKVLTYSITREIQILKEISPMGSITTEGGMTITITAMAYSDASVSATVNGSTIRMEIDDSLEEEEDRDSNYKQFVGEYTAPAATGSEQNLGNIVVNATWGGQSDSATGASIKVNKKAQIEDGVPIVITASQARTYPANTLNNIPDPNSFPLPQGAMDYAVGDEIVYKSGSTTYTYYVLSSGLRVASSDMAVANDYASGNSITGMTVKADSSYTYVSLAMAQQVSYSFRYSSTGVSVEFHYTNSVPEGLSLNANPLFSSAQWSGTTLNLSLIKQGAFMGYRGYYDDSGNLVLRFKNPPQSLSSAKIAIDPGHGGSDVGALGFLADYPEKVLNLQIARQLAAELESRGATVMLMDTSNNPSKAARVQHAENWGADYFLSIHNNTASNSSATGTEVYYFYSYSYALALNTSSNVSSQLNTTNRGAKKSYYHVTLSSEFPSVLVECGFMSNKNEYEKLINSKYQKNIAVGIADSLSNTIRSMRTDSTATGEQSVGGSVPVSTTSGGGSTNTIREDGITINYTDVTLRVGETITLQASSDAGDDITWSSGNTSVAKVDDSGTVTAVNEGTVKVTATDEEGNSAVCTVEVIDGDSSTESTTSDKLGSATEVYFKTDEIQMDVDDVYQLEIASDVGTLSASDFVWGSTDTSVAVVESDGKITAKSRGQAEITAESKDGYFGIYCTIYVD